MAQSNKGVTLNKGYHKPRLVYVDRVPPSAKPTSFNGKWATVVLEFARSGNIYAMVETGGVKPGSAVTCMREAVKNNHLSGRITVMQRSGNAYLVLTKQTTVVAGEGIRDAS